MYESELILTSSTLEPWVCAAAGEKRVSTTAPMGIQASLDNVVHQLRAAWRGPGLYQHTPKSRGVRNPNRTIAVALQPGA